MRTFARAVLPALLLALVLAPAAIANTMYSYVGDTFHAVPGAYEPRGVYTLADRITGWLIVADGFVPQPGAFSQDVTPGVLSYSFTDGHQTLTQANSTGSFRLAVLPDQRGPADLNRGWWWAGISTPTSGMTTEKSDDRYDEAWIGGTQWGLADSAGSNSAGFVTDGSHPGTWTVQTVPEPATLVLLAAALLGVGAVVWRQRRTMAP